MKCIFLACMNPGYTVAEYADAWVCASKIIRQSTGAT